MPIAFDNSSSNASTHTCSGSGRILFVGVMGTSTDYITGVTYGGVSMTLVAKHQPGSERWCYLFMLVNPASGTNNIVISPAGEKFWVAASYTGAKQTGQPDASATNLGTSITSLTTTLTTVADKCWTVGYGRSYYDLGVGAGTYLRQAHSTPNTAIVDSNGEITPAGSTSLIITQATAQWLGTIMVSISPAPTVFIPKVMMF